MKQTHKIYPLSPTLEGLYVDDSNDQIYVDKLEEAYSIREIHNIAVTGNYSIGKSRIIRLFDEQEKFIYVSLADFAAYDQKDENKKATGQGASTTNADGTDSTAAPQQAPQTGSAGAPEQDDNGGDAETPATGDKAKTEEKKDNDKAVELEQKHLEYELLCQMVSRFHKKDMPASHLQIVPENGRWILKTLAICYFLLLVFTAILAEKEPQAVYTGTGEDPSQGTAPFEESGYDVLCGTFIEFSQKFTSSSEDEPAQQQTQDEVSSDDQSEMQTGTEDFALVYMFVKKSVWTISKIWAFPWQSKGNLYASLTIWGIVLIGFGLRKIFRARMIKTATIKFDKSEVEIGAAEFSLDKYRFELVYLLAENAKHYGYTVVFEDIDRLEPEVNKKILTKLRVLNQMVNNRSRKNGCFEWLKKFSTDREKSESKKQVRFIYVLNDKMAAYLNKEKTFDYVLSIIPTLSVQNAKERLMLSYLINEGIQGEKKWGALISVVSPYLTNYRTVHSVMNDFQVFRAVYQNSLNGDAYNPSKDGNSDNQQDTSDIMMRKLFAFVVYKNLWPEDYNRIRDGESVVFNLSKLIAKRGTNRRNLVISDPVDLFNQKQIPSDYQVIAQLLKMDEKYLRSDSLQFIGYSTSVVADSIVQQNMLGHGAEAWAVFKNGICEQKKTQ